MKLMFKKQMDAQQPAIDTCCDNCGAIYDLLDCTTCATGAILCTDCSCEQLAAAGNMVDKQVRFDNNISHVFNGFNSAQ